jgi:hypothetical protein
MLDRAGRNAKKEGEDERRKAEGESGHEWQQSTRVTDSRVEVMALAPVDGMMK